MAEWFSIIIASLILEDPTTILVSTRVHDGHLSWAAGGTALFIGIMIGDIGLYALGYAARVGIIKRNLDHLSKPVTGWYVFAARFAPGLRVIVYTTSGFFKYPFIRFFVFNSISCVVWSVLLIVVGQQVYEYTGWWGVGGIVAAIVIWQIAKKYFNGRKTPAEKSLP
jgi:membrane protein DedA with SNARE-associated domain